MSSRLPSVTAANAIRAFARAGWHIAGQKGSHVHLRRAGSALRLVIPKHTGDLKRPLLKTLLKYIGMTEDEFRKLL